MKKTNTYLLLSFALLLSLTQCRCKDDKKPCNDPTNVNCENYDPCYGKKPTADFTLRQWDGWAIKPEDAIPEDCDTILLHGIRAQALSPVAQSYSWKIGTDDREFTDKELRMTFSNYKNDSNNLNPDNNHYYKPIPVTLTVRNPESQCVGANDTVLQRTRNLVSS